MPRLHDCAAVSQVASSVAQPDPSLSPPPLSGTASSDASLAAPSCSTAALVEEPTAEEQDNAELLRDAANAEDGEGKPLYAPTDPSRPIGDRNPPRRVKGKPAPKATRPTRYEVERRIAEAQLWIAQRKALNQIYENARDSWNVTNIQTLNRYLNVARQRMVEELVRDRKRHQAEQIFALNECARRAMEAEQFSAAVGAFRVIAEIGGMLRAPLKPPEARS